MPSETGLNLAGNAVFDGQACIPATASVPRTGNRATAKPLGLASRALLGFFWRRGAFARALGRFATGAFRAFAF
jgi:hypothetical protein